MVTFASPSNDTQTNEIRSVAVEHHHQKAGWFESNYEKMAKSRFSNAFTYGRHKVNVLFENELKRLPAGARVLDVGCGTGIYLQRIKELGYEPVGLEPAKAMLAIARRDNPDVEVKDGLCTALPFESASVDFIVAMEVYRYLDRNDLRASLRECLRVLKPGGIFFATMVNRWALDGFFVLQRARQFALGKDFDDRHPHCEFFTPGELRDEVTKQGLVNVRVQGRLLAPMRMAYKVSPALGTMLAQRVESLDDTLNDLPFMTPLAGHLLVVAERPRD